MPFQPAIKTLETEERRLNLKIVIRAPNRQELDEGNKRSGGVEENKERHERNPRFEQSVLNILHWLLPIGSPK